MMAPVRVVIVEDNDTFRETLELLFGMRDEVEVVGDRLDGQRRPEGVCRRVARRRPDGLPHAGAERRRSDARRARGVPADARRLPDGFGHAAGGGGAPRPPGPFALVTKDEDFDRLVAAVCEAAAE